MCTDAQRSRAKLVPALALGDGVRTTQADARLLPTERETVGRWEKEAYRTAAYAPRSDAGYRGASRLRPVGPRQGQADVGKFPEKREMQHSASVTLQRYTGS